MHEISDELDERVLEDLPDWVFQPPRPSVDPRVALLDGSPDPRLVQDQVARDGWRDRRAVLLESLGLPSAYSAASRPFWQGMRVEERRRRPVEASHEGTDETGPPPQ